MLFLPSVPSANRIYYAASSIDGVSSLTASAVRYGIASFTITANSELFANAIYKWNNEPDVAEVWTSQDDTAETWTQVADTNETWTAQNDTSEIWTAVVDTTETWTQTLH
jgi:hypothetical protein